MRDVPLHIWILFILTVISIVGFIYYAVNFAARKDKNDNLPLIILTFVVIWLFSTAVLSFYDFFIHFDQLYRLILLIAIPLVLFLAPLADRKSRVFLHKMPLTTLTYIHIVRVPLEITFWWLAIDGIITAEMTFEGTNFDILSGISAPFAAIFLVGLRSKSRIGASIWNLAALGLSIYVFHTAISFSPYLLQGSGQASNYVLFRFPFVWVFGFVFPVIIASHLISLFKIIGDPDPDY